MSNKGACRTAQATPGLLITVEAPSEILNCKSCSCFLTKPKTALLQQSLCIISLVVLMRPCLNELQKEYYMKTKVIALDWQWVTLRSWCQMNRNGHSSQVKHRVDGKPHNICEKLKITSGKSTFFDIFFWSIFSISFMKVIDIFLNGIYHIN